MDLDIKKMIMGMISVAIALVLVIGCAVPIISDSVATDDTYKNEGIKLSKVGTDSSHTIEWDHTDPNVITIDDTSIEMSSTANPRGFVFGSENFYLKWYSLGDTKIGVQFFSGDTRMDGNISSSKDMTITVASGSVSVTAGTDTNTYTLGDNAYILDSTGSYVLKQGLTANVLADTEIVIVDAVQVASGYPAGIFAIGNVEDGMTYSAFFYNPSSVSFASPTMTSASVDGHIDLYNVTGFGVTATQGDTTRTVTFNTFIVPSEVTAERSVHADSTVNAILVVIPLLMVVGIVISAISLFITNRRD